MRYKFKGQVEVININLGKRLNPGDVVEVDGSNKELVNKLEVDALFEKVEGKPVAKSKDKKDGD